MKKERFSMYKGIVRPLLFRLEAERAHRWALNFLFVLQEIYWLCRWLRKRRPDPWMKVLALGQTFSSPIGVAAGFDKNGQVTNALGALGFGFVEVGSITAKPREGLAKPRVFRQPDHGAILNRMGLPNDGYLGVFYNLMYNKARHVIVGISLSATPNEAEALPKIYASLSWLAAGHSKYVHYIVLNLSCPNATGLKVRHSIEMIDAVLREVQRELSPLPIRVPVLVKISPDLEDAEIDQIADLAVAHGIEGIVATNTTASVMPSPLVHQPASDPAEQTTWILGGISGRPLRARSLEIVRRIYARTQGQLTIIASGGIETPEHAWEAICAGASLIQVFTAMVYEGPFIAWKLHQGLAEILRRSPFRCLEEAVGSAHRVLVE